MNTVHAHGGPLHEFESDPDSYESPAIQQATTPEIVIVSGLFIVLAIATVLLAKQRRK